MVIEIWKRTMQKFEIEKRTYAYTFIKKESSPFLSDNLGIPKGYPIHIPVSLLNPQPKQLIALQSRLSKLGLSVNAIEVKILFSWLFTSSAAFEDFIAYGSRSKAWDELSPIVTTLMQLQSMDALIFEMTRQEAEDALRKKTDFSFLIRLSVTYPRSFVVSTIKDDKFWHTFITATLYGIHSWSIFGKQVVSYFFPSANRRNSKNSSTILVDVARFTAAGRNTGAVWETRLFSPITGEKIASGVYKERFSSAKRIEKEV